ncbi:MAG: hypothetical protein ACI9FJ_001890 [Alteromonadaceae bacterium]
MVPLSVKQRANGVMTDNYYLINEQIKFYFDIEKQFVEFKGETESLEPKEAQILKYILENNNDGMIKSEAILDDNWDYWNDKKVLQKVLSTLRKKFKSINVAENGFVAAGSNYKINYVGVLLNTHTQEIKEKNAHKNKIVTSVKTAVLWALAGAISLLLIIKFNEKPAFTVDNIIQATAISGVSIEPALSPDGSALVFSHKTEASSQIYLKTDLNLNFQVLTEGHFDQIPSWSPSGRQIAFQRLKQGACEIRLITLNEDNVRVDGDEKIVDCNINNNLASITWNSENTLYFTDPDTASGPYNIKYVNVQKKTVSPYFTYPEHTDYTGSGHYYITFHKPLNALYSLESPNWVVSNIAQIDADNQVTPIHQVNDILLTVGIFNNNIIFKDLDNQLKALSLSNTDDLITIYKNPLKPIVSPNVSANNNKIVIASGSVFKKSIYAMSLKTGGISEIISSQYNLKTPQENNNEMFYISKETGIYQIYLYRKNIRTQLTNYNVHRKIVYFTTSADKKWAAVNFIDSTVLYQRNEKGLVAVKTFPLMSFPAFSQDGERILLTNLVQQQNGNSDSWEKELVEFSLDGFEETGITVKNALFGRYHQSGIIYVSVHSGIKLFTLNGVRTIIDLPGPEGPNAFSVNSTDMFISKNNTVHKVNLRTREVTQLPQQIKGSITANDEYIFFGIQTFGTMDIFKGELIDN